MKAVEILCYSCVIVFLFLSSLLVLSAKLIIKSMFFVHNVVDGVIVST